MTPAEPSILDVPIGTPAAVVSYKPVEIAAPGRGTDLQVRVSAPLEGEGLPVIVFSHGMGFSMDAYGPLTEFWAARGFAVIQPTHLDSVSLGLAPDDPRTPDIWRHRIDDLVRVLDELDMIQASVPGLGGRLDPGRVAAAGHSYGATSASALLGARVLDPDGRPGDDWTDARVSAGALLSLAGTGGDDLTPFAAENFPFMNPGFDEMRAPALIVGGDADQSLLSVRGPDWWSDAFRLSPGPKEMLTVFGAEHSLGGIHAYGSIPQTPAEAPALLALVQRMTTAYLRTALDVDATSWAAAREALSEEADPAGSMESR